jgi:hypothetical protein
VPDFSASLQKRGRMIAPLDIFVANGDRPVWLGCAETLVDALTLIRNKGVGSYVVYSHQTGHTNHYEVNADGHVSAAPTAEV